MNMPENRIEKPDKPREECGIFGVYGKNLDVSRITYYGLYALQHRGQESAGIAVSDGKKVMLHKDMGLVPEVFSQEQLDKLKGHIAIGHVRYSTTGSSHPINAQPLVFRYAKGTLGLAHNGNITNIWDLRSQLTSTGSVFQSTTDSEVIVNLIARYSQNTLEEALAKCMIDVKGAYSLLLITENSLIAVRDPYGFRPLSLGKLGDGYVVASESCALDTVGATKLRDVEPGEIIIIDDKGVRSIRALSSRKKAHCIFEYIYFARPDSEMDGFQISQAFLFDLKVTRQHFLGVLADQDFAQILQVRQAFQKQDALDDLVSMLHRVDGLMILMRTELFQTPVFVHARMQKVLVNSDQLVSEDLVEMLDDCNVAFHVRGPADGLCI